MTSCWKGKRTSSEIRAKSLYCQKYAAQNMDYKYFNIGKHINIKQTHNDNEMADSADLPAMYAYITASQLNVDVHADVHVRNGTKFGNHKNINTRNENNRYDLFKFSVNISSNNWLEYCPRNLICLEIRATLHRFIITEVEDRQARLYSLDLA